VHPSSKLTDERGQNHAPALRPTPSRYEPARAPGLLVGGVRLRPQSWTSDARARERGRDRNAGVMEGGNE